MVLAHFLSSQLNEIALAALEDQATHVATWVPKAKYVMATLVSQAKFVNDYKVFDCSCRLTGNYATLGNGTGGNCLTRMPLDMEMYYLSRTAKHIKSSLSVKVQRLARKKKMTKTVDPATKVRL